MSCGRCAKAPKHFPSLFFTPTRVIAFTSTQSKGERIFFRSSPLFCMYKLSPSIFGLVREKLMELKRLTVRETGNAVRYIFSWCKKSWVSISAVVFGWLIFFVFLGLSFPVRRRMILYGSYEAGPSVGERRIPRRKSAWEERRKMESNGNEGEKGTRDNEQSQWMTTMTEWNQPKVSEGSHGTQSLSLDPIY